MQISPAIGGAPCGQELAAAHVEKGVVLPRTHCRNGAPQRGHLLGRHHWCLHPNLTVCPLDM